MYGKPVHNGVGVESVSVNKFRDNLKTYVEQVVSDHAPLKVTRRSGEDFVVMSAEDWAREQETLYVMQNESLMQQISASLETHNANGGYQPSKEQLDEMLDI